MDLFDRIGAELDRLNGALAKVECEWSQRFALEENIAPPRYRPVELDRSLLHELTRVFATKRRLWRAFRDDLMDFPASILMAGLLANSLYLSNEQQSLETVEPLVIGTEYAAGLPRWKARVAEARAETDSAGFAVRINKAAEAPIVDGLQVVALAVVLKQGALLGEFNAAVKKGGRVNRGLQYLQHLQFG